MQESSKELGKKVCEERKYARKEARNYNVGNKLCKKSSKELGKKVCRKSSNELGKKVCKKRSK